MTAATTSTGAAVSAKSDSQTTWRTRRHQPAADLIVAHDLKQLAVKHAELLAQDPAGDQQRFDDRGQVRMVAGRSARIGGAHIRPPSIAARSVGGSPSHPAGPPASRPRGPGNPVTPPPSPHLPI